MALHSRYAITTVMLIFALTRLAHGETYHLGSHTADFSLQDTHGGRITYSAKDHKITVVIFISTRCPMSNAFNARINDLYNDFSNRATFLVVNSNADESIEQVRQHAARVGYDFAVYKDLNNVVADLFGALATPEAFVIDESGVLRYHGIIEDGANPSRTTQRPLRAGLESLLKHQPISMAESHGRGCAIRRVHGITR